ncbi:MAG: NAD(P)H-hydrate dehydratase [Bacteroidales bacterium]|nr:NAD(P)H-hydrate dehydratase [Bacteroidales bacterium]
MKILPIEKIREADAYTIRHEPIADIDLMERAAGQLSGWLTGHYPTASLFRIFCGTGNNGGDGLALGRLLVHEGHKAVAHVIKYSDKMSESCLTNYERALQTQGFEVKELYPGNPPPDIGNDDIVVDAIFGSGLSKPVSGLPAEVINHINASGTTVIAVDVPSGFFCDGSNAGNTGAIVKARHTLTFQLPKLGFLFPENEKYAGEWHVLPIGLHPDFIREVEVKNHFTEEKDILPLLRHRGRFDHKGRFGHGLLISGSYGKTGAAVLAASAALRSGPGLITAHVPASSYMVMQTAVPEAMLSIDEDEKIFSILPALSPYSSIAAGPGLGTAKASAQALKLLIQNAGRPLIFDADALNILSENKTWIPFVPKGSIFTPHQKEFERLTSKAANDFERNALQREFAVKYGVYVILKGAYTAIACPDGSCRFNSTGNPGMATGGSGDVLTGILLGLSAQGYTPLETCLLGTFIHGLAGDLALESQGPEALTAGDIVDHIGQAFKLLWKDKNTFDLV